ncbi:hypothetical protein TNCV_2389841 [Trichonephila clavipes]|nr:hypothetical protein TNCV_2389841 [Trichonephila clavipes]
MILAYVGIDENEVADTLAKEVRQLNSKANTATLVTLSDINSVAKSRLNDKKIKLKHQIPEIDTSRNLAKHIIKGLEQDILRYPTTFGTVILKRLING